MIDLTADKPAEHVDLTDGDDEKAGDDKLGEDMAVDNKPVADKTVDDKPDGKPEGDKADETKTDEAKPEETDSSVSRKRPREDDEGVYLFIQYYCVNISILLLFL